MNFKLNTEKTVAVSTDVYWEPINESTPRGVKLMLINRQANVAKLGMWDGKDTFWTHFATLPQWRNKGTT